MLSPGSLCTEHLMPGVCFPDLSIFFMESSTIGLISVDIYIKIASEHWPGVKHIRLCEWPYDDAGKNVLRA